MIYGLYIRYESSSSEEEPDTDTETDRLLGQKKAAEETNHDKSWRKPRPRMPKSQTTGDLAPPSPAESADSNKEREGSKKKSKTREVLIEGVLFRARYLGSTQLVCDGQPTKATRMIQAEEAVSRIKETDGGRSLEAGDAWWPEQGYGCTERARDEPIRDSPRHEDRLGTEDQRDVLDEEIRPPPVSLHHQLLRNGWKYRPEALAPWNVDASPVSPASSSDTVPARPSHKPPPQDGAQHLALSSRASSPLYQEIPCRSRSSSPLYQEIGTSPPPSQERRVTPPPGWVSSGSLLDSGIVSLHETGPSSPLGQAGPPPPVAMFSLSFRGSVELDQPSELASEMWHLGPQTEDVGPRVRRARRKAKERLARKAVAYIRVPAGEPQPTTDVDLFISTEKIMVLNTTLKEIMMDHALRTISYIADIGDLVVLMARRREPAGPEAAQNAQPTPKMVCHVFESDEAQFIAQSIGQAFQVAYMEFLKANGIDDHGFVKEMDYQEVLNSQEIFGEELKMFAKKELQKEVVVPKQKGEILGVVIVESGWGSLVPTVVIANLASSGAAARCGLLNIGDQIIAINGISLVGLPLAACQTYVKNTKPATVVKLTVVPCPPVVEVKIRRPDTKYQLGFSVQNGVICSLLRGGIAERGGVRVGHRIIEINSQSVVAVPHDRIVSLLATSVGEILMKTMPTSLFRLLTGQETPLYI